jgi:hypothetical protein
MKPDASPTERFTGWFVRSIEKLKELPEGDGAFAAMMIALPLYERGIIAKLKLDGKQTSEENIARAIGADLELDEGQRKVFWAMFRNGFMHQGMAMAGKTQWLVSHRFGALPEFRTYEGRSCVCVDPWKFAGRVLSAFLKDPRLITESESFPLAGVFPVLADALAPALAMKSTGQPDNRIDKGAVSQVILLGGLPGSGKTTHMDQLARDGWKLYDDFQANAYDNSPRFTKARRYAELIQALRLGQRCVVSDIRFVCAGYRAEAQQALHEAVGELSLEWRLFANDAPQCAKNIQHAARQRQAAPRLAVLQEFSKKYSLPQGVLPLPIWRRPS